MKQENKHLNILFSVLLFGGLWGIVEATLGTLLHLPGFEETGLFSIKLSLEFDAVQQVDGTMDFKVY